MHIWTCKYCGKVETFETPSNHTGWMVCNSCYGADDWVVEEYPTIGAVKISTTAGYEIFSKQQGDRREYIAFPDCPDCRGKGYKWAARPRIDGRYAGSTSYPCKTCNSRWFEAKQVYYATVAENYNWYWRFYHYKRDQVYAQIGEQSLDDLAARGFPRTWNTQDEWVEHLRVYWLNLYDVKTIEIKALAQRLYPYPPLDEYLQTRVIRKPLNWEKTDE